MKKPTSRTLALYILLGATLSLPAWAGGSVTLRQGASETIELTNLDEPDAGQPQVAEGPAGAAAALATPVPRQSAQASKSTLRGKRLAGKDPAKDAEDADSTTEETTADANMAPGYSVQDSYRPAETESRSAAIESQPAPAGNGQSATGGSYGASYTQGAPGASGSTSSGTGAVSGTGGSTASSGGGSTSGSGAGATTPAAPLTGIQAILSQYRDLMVQEASAANYMNTNPAISRRYLAVDRTTYQARLGR